MLTLAFSSTRRHFLKATAVLGANLTALVVLVKCKTVGAGAALREDESGADPDFMAMSKGLTGHDNLDGTLAQSFHSDLKLTFGEDKVADLISAYKDAASGDESGAQVKDKIMEHESYGKMATAAIMLWYGGTHNKLTVAQPLAVKAYQKSLVWKMFSGGKPMGVPMDEESGWGVKPADEA